MYNLKMYKNVKQKSKAFFTCRGDGDFLKKVGRLVAKYFARWFLL